MQSLPSPAEETVDLRAYVAVLKRRTWLIVSSTCLMTILAGAYSFTRTPMYTAQTEVLVQPADASSQYRPDQLVSLDTEARLAKSAPVAVLAKDTLGWDITIPELLKRVEVQTTPDTLVLDIFFSDGISKKAADGAAAFAASYLDYKRQRSLDAATSARDSIQKRLDELQGSLDKLNREIEQEVPGTLEYQTDNQQRDSINGQVAILTSELVQLPPVTDPGEIILPASPPLSPSSPKHPIDLAMGFLFGAFVGVVLAFVRDRTDERITGRADLEATLESPVLAAIPTVTGWKKRGPVWLVTEQQPRSPASEAYRTLRSGVMAMARRRDLKVLAILSPVQGEGKTTTAANLAVTLSHADNKVLVIGADLRRPSLYRYFQVDNDVGLSDVLLGEVPVDEAIRAVSPNLWLLVNGRVPARPAELLQSHRMSELLARMRDRFDFVLIDCPPVLGLADSLSIAPLADAVLLVASAGETKRGAIVHAIDQLGQVGAKIFGGILNNVTLSKRGGSYGYGYGYGYGYDEASEEDESISRVDRVHGRTSAANGNGNPKTKDPERTRQDKGPDGDEVPVEPTSRPEAISRRDT